MFTSKYFIDALIENDEHIRFSGSGSAYHNGVVKYGIQTVIQMAHTMIIHSVMSSPHGTITAGLWPIIIDHAVCLYNLMPRENYVMFTYELWSHSSFINSKYILSTCHNWGSPAYVLETKLQKGGLI